MNKQFLFRPWMVLCVVVVGLGIGTTKAQVAAPVKVGRFWSMVVDHGGQPRASITSGWFPADFNVVGSRGTSGSAATGNIYLTTTNWTDATGKKIAKVVCAAKSEYNILGTVVEPLVAYTRYDMPINLLNGVDVAEPALGVTDPTKCPGTSEQYIENTFEYAIGVQANRKVLAWSQENHDDYIITDVTFTNVGSVDLTDFVISYCIGPNDYSVANGSNPTGSMQHSSWHWRHYYGTMPEDSQRVTYTYHADDPTTSGDNMGEPIWSQQGRLLRPDVWFYGFLHIGGPYTDAADDVNDPVQPRITYAAEGQVVSMPSENARQGAPVDNAPWFDVAQGKLAIDTPDPDAPEGTLHMLNSDETGDPDFQFVGPSITYNGWTAYDYVGIGPYTFKPGESIHLVYVVGNAGIGLKKAKEIGKALVDKTLEPPSNLPDPDVGYFPSNFKFPEGADEWDINKDLWLSTGIDSVHKTMYHAQWNYDHNYNVPAAPPPPDIDVGGFPDHVSVKWSSPEAEALSNFDGYRVMARISNMDTAFFQVVHTTDATDKKAEHEWKTSDVKFGASYFYYVQSSILVAEDDANALPSIRGKKLWSGRTYLANKRSLEPPRGAASDLSKIAVVPNPYNINDPTVMGMGWTDYRGILFFELPAYCDIRIYTEDGDLVKQIIHDSPVNAGTVFWDMITDSEQAISSGIYIALFTDKDGEVAYRKFVVVR